MPPEDNLKNPPAQTGQGTPPQNTPQPQAFPPQVPAASQFQNQIPQPPSVTPPQQVQNQQPPLAPSPQTPMSPPVAEPKKPHHTILKILIALLILVPLLAIGGSLAWAYQGYPLISPPEPVKNVLDTAIVLSPLPKPKRIVIETTLANTSKLKTADAKTEFSITASGPNAPVDSFKLTMSGPIDFEKFANGSLQNAQADIGLEVNSQGQNFSASASFRNVDNTLYFKINQIPTDQAYSEITPYVGNWYFYKIPQEYLKPEQDKQAQQKVASVIKDFVDKTPAWTKTTSEDNNFYNLEITPPKSELANFLFDLGVAAETDPKYQPTADDKAQIEKVLDKISDLKISAKIGKQDYFLNELKITFSVNINDLYGAYAPSDNLPAGTPSVYDFSFTTDLSNFNQPVTITAPEGAQDFQKVINDMNRKYTSENTAITENQADIKTKDDMLNIATALQAYYVSPGQGSFPTDLNKLLENGDLKTLPIPPTETGWNQYLYMTYPKGCDGTSKNYCQEASLFGPLTSPQTPLSGWCWQSTTGKSQEKKQADCTAAPNSNPPAPSPTPSVTPSTLQPTPIPQASASASPVLGAKYYWERSVVNLFENFLK